MKKFNITTFILVSWVFITHAQPDPPSIADAKHILWIVSDLKICIVLRSYSESGEEECFPYINHYSIDKNLTKDDKGKKIMELNFYRLGHFHDKDSIMNINLYFDDMRELETYCLDIPLFTPGHRTVHINPDEKKKTKWVSIDLHDHKVVKVAPATLLMETAVDITDIVFPGYGKKKKE